VAVVETVAMMAEIAEADVTDRKGGGSIAEGTLVCK
jgi:hypothetical protein